MSAANPQAPQTPTLKSAGKKKAASKSPTSRYRWTDHVTPVQLARLTATERRTMERERFLRECNYVKGGFLRGKNSWRCVAGCLRMLSGRDDLMDGVLSSKDGARAINLATKGGCRLLLGLPEVQRYLDYVWTVRGCADVPAGAGCPGIGEKLCPVGSATPISPTPRP